MSIGAIMEPGTYSTSHYGGKLWRYPNGVVEAVAYLRPKALRYGDPDTIIGYREGFIKRRERIRSEDQAEREAAEAANRRRTARRATSKVRRSALCLQVDRLLTLTYRDNFRDLKAALGHVRRFVRLYAARYPKFVYIAVHEYQQRGALHFHLGVRGWLDVGYARACWRRIVSEGNIDVTHPRRRAKGMDPVELVIAGYLAKYISKAFAQQRERYEHRYTGTRVDTDGEAIPIGADSYRGACDELGSFVVNACGVILRGVVFSDDWGMVWYLGVPPPSA